MRLKNLLSEKIQQVQRAEIEQRWNLKTIEKETEFLSLVKNLIEESEVLKFENLNPAPTAETLLRDNLIRELLIEVYSFRISQNAYMILNNTTAGNLMEYKKLNVKGTQQLINLVCADHYRQDAKTAPEAQKKLLQSTVKKLENDKAY